jgi:anti-anti-sigma regulatory factor
MSLYILAHPWDVHEVADGTVVQITRQDLNAQTVSILIEELHELALESGQPRLYLDFGAVRCLGSLVPGKLLTLERRLKEMGVQLVLGNLDRAVLEVFAAEGWPHELAAV